MAYGATLSRIGMRDFSILSIFNIYYLLLFMLYVMNIHVCY